MTPFRSAFLESRGRSFRESPGKARLLDPCLSGPGEVPIAELTLGDVTLWELTQDFGGGEDYPAGTYVVRYCHGFWGDNIATDTVAVTTTHVGQEEWNLGRRIFVAYNDGSNTAVFNEEKPPSASLPPAVIEANASGVFTSFTHTGGTISLVFTDRPDADNWVTDAMPVFTLYRVSPRLVEMSASAAILTTPNHYRGTFVVRNRCNLAFTGITATLLAQDGISNVVATDAFDISAKGTASIVIDFDLGDGNPVGTASIEITYEGSVTQTLVFELAPAIVKYTQTTVFTPQTCSGNTWRTALAVQNVGNVETQALSLEITCSSTLKNATCTETTTFPVGRLVAGAVSGNIMVHVPRDDYEGGDWVELSAIPSDGTLEFPELTWSVRAVVPATPAFTWTIIGGVAHFTDQSIPGTGAIVGWQWIYKDFGYPYLRHFFSSEQNPTKSPNHDPEEIALAVTDEYGLGTSYVWHWVDYTP